MRNLILITVFLLITSLHSFSQISITGIYNEKGLVNSINNDACAIQGVIIVVKCDTNSIDFNDFYYGLYVEFYDNSGVLTISGATSNYYSRLYNNNPIDEITLTGLTPNNYYVDKNVKIRAYLEVYPNGESNFTYTEFTQFINFYPIVLKPIVPLNVTYGIGENPIITSLTTIPSGWNMIWSSYTDPSISFTGKAFTAPSISKNQILDVSNVTNEGCKSSPSKINLIYTTSGSAFCRENIDTLFRTKPEDNAYSFGNYFFDENVGILADESFIYLTTNSGLSFIKKEVCLPRTRAGYVVNETTAYLAGLSNKLFRTTDKGNSWENISTATGLENSNGYRSCYFIDENEGYLGTRNGKIYKTLNKGLNWEKFELDKPDYFIQDFYFMTSTTGFLVAYDSFSPISDIYITTNTGLTWSSVYTTTGYLRTISFVTSLIGFAAGGGDDGYASNGKVYKTTDGGLSWNLIVDTGLEYNFIYDLLMLNENEGYACTHQNNILKTLDGWQTWTLATLPSYSDLENYSLVLSGLSKFSKLPSGKIIVNDYDGRIYKFDPCVPQIFSIAPPTSVSGFLSDDAFKNPKIKLFPNPTTNYISIQSSKYMIEKVEISNALGIKINTISVGDYLKEINLADLQKGIYFFKLYYNQGIINEKVMLE